MKEIEIKNDKNTLLTENSHAYKLVTCKNIKLKCLVSYLSIILPSVTQVALKQTQVQSIAQAIQLLRTAVQKNR